MRPCHTREREKERQWVLEYRAKADGQATAAGKNMESEEGDVVGGRRQSEQKGSGQCHLQEAG